MYIHKSPASEMHAVEPRRVTKHQHQAFAAHEPENVRVFVHVCHLCLHVQISSKVNLQSVFLFCTQ